MIKKVLIFGGTHGNEWTGTTVVTHFSDVLKQKFPRLDLHFILANPEAFVLNKRFKDEDLNRAFMFLQEKRPESFEHQRAIEIKKLIELEPCFVIDLHTTTSNMGKTVILSHNHPMNLKLSAKLIEKDPKTKVILSPDPNKKFLASQSETGLMVEVGPVCNGIIHPKILSETLELVTDLLSAIDGFNENQTGELEVYEEIEDVYYPKDSLGKQAAYVHEDFQDMDFIPFSGKFKALKNFNGEEVFHTSNEELYPIFINEAAYYPTGLAFTLCRKRKVTY